MTTSTPHRPGRLRARSLALLAALLTALPLGGGARAEPDSLYRLPAGSFQLTPDAIRLSGQEDATYVEGFGWLTGLALEPPQRVGDEVYAGAELLAWLGFGDLPRVDEVRFGGDAGVRVVLDLDGVDAAALAAALPRRGRVPEGEALSLTLPRLLVPLSLPDPYRGFVLDLDTDGADTTATLSGPGFAYEVLVLDAPARVVIDAVPVEAPLPDLEEALAPGVRYRRFAFPNGVGRTSVHLLEIAPDAGEFRVVGESRTPRPIGELASGAFAAINGGYFDTRSFEAIGLLKVDYGVTSLPSRGRASVGFGEGGAVIDRVSGRARLWLGGRLFETDLAGGDLSVVTGAGAAAGSPRQGVLVVEGGRVTSNTVGPRRVPEGGFAVVYPAEERHLALLDPGASATLDVQLLPSAFRTARYAVEAGPLLVRGGAAAFAPDRESFVRGQRILDAYTQQAAIGVRPDGTVLLAVAQSMRASDLVPLFLSLGARDAMRLDSGSSAMLWADGGLLSGGRERRVVSAIVFIPAAATP